MGSVKSFGWHSSGTSSYLPQISCRSCRQGCRTADRHRSAAPPPQPHTFFVCPGTVFLWHFVVCLPTLLRRTDRSVYNERTVDLNDRSNNPKRFLSQASPFLLTGRPAPQPDKHLSRRNRKNRPQGRFSLRERPLAPDSVMCSHHKAVRSCSRDLCV